jgi:hypothetical protein
MPAARKISRFSDNWEYRDSISLVEISMLNFCADGKGNIFLHALTSEPDGNMHVDFIKLEPLATLLNLPLDSRVHLENFELSLTPLCIKFYHPPTMG